MPTDPPPPARVAAEGPKMSPIDRLEWLAEHVSPMTTVHGSPLAAVLREILAALPTCSACGLTHDAAQCPRCAPTLVGRLYSLAREVRAQAAERMRWRSVPCQTDQLWHADEFNAWAHEIKSVARSMEGRKEQS